MSCTRLALGGVLLVLYGCATSPAAPPVAEKAEPVAPVIPAVAVAPAPDPALEAVRSDYGIALAQVEAGALEEATILLREIIARAPRAATPLATLAIVQLRLERLEAAAESLRQAIALRPEAAFHNQLGIILRRQGQFSAARQHYEQALALDAGFARAHLNLAILCELYLGEPATALTHYRRYQQLTAAGEHDQVVLWIGDLERRIKGAP